MASKDKEKVNILPISLTPKKILLLGAGAIAKQKAKAILQSDCELTTLSKEIKEPFFNNLGVILKPFELVHVEGFDVVVDATADEKIGELLWKNRKKYGYLLNVVDVPKYCDFYFNASVRQGELCVSVSSGGASPTLAQNVRDKISRVLPNTLKPLVEKLKIERANGKIEQKVANNESKKALGKVFLIGCGTGSVENLTLKALNTFELLDVALVDALVGKEIVKLLPTHCKIVDVSKQKGEHKFTQEQINETMLEYAKDGLSVGRLKGGDPMVFGRVYEESTFLLSHGVEMELISGITSSLASCLQAGVTPTLRDVSSGALIVSAHLRETKFNDEWLELLKNSPYTVIVLMAYSFASKIVESAKNRAVSLETPAVFVSKIDSKEQTSVFGTLGELEKMALECSKPAVLILGQSVKHSLNMPQFGNRVVL